MCTGKESSLTVRAPSTNTLGLGQTWRSNFPANRDGGVVCWLHLGVVSSIPGRAENWGNNTYILSVFPLNKGKMHPPWSLQDD